MMRATAVLLLGALLSACTASPEATPPAPVVASPTPLDQVDTATVTVQRATFCPMVAPAEVAAALGGAATREDTWGNGDPLPGGGRGDIAHEYGCAWIRGKVRALAWVFAPPVSVARASQLAQQSAGMKCQHWAGAPAFGKPSAGEDCTLNIGTRILTLHGLFGDAWLSCSLLVVPGEPTARLAQRTERWCAAVLAAARTP
jgi:hypothetical protein